MHTSVSRLLFTGVAILSINACAAPDSAGERDESRASAEPATGEAAFSGSIDLSTPDRAIKSYWAVQDHMLAASESWDRRWSALTFDLQRGVLGGAALADLESGDRAGLRMAREILEVRQETDTRAVVVARLRNITPVPAGAVIDEAQRKARSEGEVVRYIMERFGDGWRLTQIQQQYWEGDDWRNRFTPDDLSVPTFVTP